MSTKKESLNTIIAISKPNMAKLKDLKLITGKSPAEQLEIALSGYFRNQKFAEQIVEASEQFAAGVVPEIYLPDPKAFLESLPTEKLHENAPFAEQYEKHDPVSEPEHILLKDQPDYVAEPEHAPPADIVVPTPLEADKLADEPTPELFPIADPTTFEGAKTLTHGPSVPPLFAQLNNQQNNK